MNFKNKIIGLLSKPETDQVNRLAIDATLTAICHELGMGTPPLTNAVPGAVLPVLGSIKESLIVYKNSLMATQVIQLVREGKRVPKWMQKALSMEQEARAYNGIPEEVKM